MIRKNRLRMEEKRDRMKQIRRSNLWKVILVALLGCVVLVAGFIFRARIQAGGHPRLSNFVLAVFVLGTFALFMWAGVLHSRMKQAMVTVLKEDIEAIRQEYVAPVEQTSSMNVDDMLARSIPDLHRYIVWCEQFIYKGVPVAVSKVHFWQGNGENRTSYDYLVFTLPVAEETMPMYHTRAFDLLKGKKTWSEVEENTEFQEIVTEEWSRALDCAAMETRRLNSKKVVDIALRGTHLFEKGKLSDPEAYLQWYREQMCRMCEYLDKLLTLSVIKSE